MHKRPIVYTNYARKKRINPKMSSAPNYHDPVLTWLTDVGTGVEGLMPAEGPWPLGRGRRTQLLILLPATVGVRGSNTHPGNRNNWSS